MEVNFRGSEQQVVRELYSIFPVGTSKNEVLLIAKSKLKLGESKLKSHDYGEHPLVLKEDEKEIYVYSWVEINIAEYRSIKRMFIKTTVVAKLFFDESEKLNGIEVKIYGDSL